MSVALYSCACGLTATLQPGQRLDCCDNAVLATGAICGALWLAGMESDPAADRYALPVMDEQGQPTNRVEVRFPFFESPYVLTVRMGDDPGALPQGGDRATDPAEEGKTQPVTAGEGESGPVAPDAPSSADQPEDWAVAFARACRNLTPRGIDGDALRAAIVERATGGRTASAREVEAGTPEWRACWGIQKALERGELEVVKRGRQVVLVEREAG